MAIIDERVDPDDLEFMTPFDRLTALGLEPENVLSTEPVREKIVIQARQKLVPGRIIVRIADVCRERGVVHKTGQHAGKISVMDLTRGADLAYTTALEYIHNPEKLAMLYMETLARLCDYLKCQPGDLLRYEPGSPTRNSLSEQYKKGR